MKTIEPSRSRLQKTARASRDCPSFRRRPEVSERARLRSSIHALLAPGLRRGDDVLPSRFSRQTDSKKKQRGFTLVELVIVIVVLGILGAMGAEFISQAFKGFFDTDIRMEMYEEGKSALVRMEREIHIAVPNAVQEPFDSDADTVDDTISFGVVDENVMTRVFGQYTEAYPTDGTTITDKKTTQLLQGTPLVSIYNTTWDDFAAAGNRIYRVSSVAFVNVDQMTINLDPAKKIGPASPYGRYYIVRPEAVRFSVINGVLSRYTATVTAVSPFLTSFATPQTLAQNIQPAIDSAKTAPNNKLPYFTYDPGTSTRNSVVTINFAISRNGETVTFHKEVQVRNVP
jgi:MSHA biogenesis protein MshO